MVKQSVGDIGSSNKKSIGEKGGGYCATICGGIWQKLQGSAVEKERQDRLKE